MNNEVLVLLVEDNMSDADLTIRALQKGNFTNNIIHLKDGEEALNFLYNEGEYKNNDGFYFPKVILLDLKMPKINGFEVLEKLKSDERTRSIPIIILSSSKEDPDIEKAYLLGANGYIVKPVNFDEFLVTMREIGMFWLIQNKTVN